ncbi:hypothetical protein EV421DRAFT_2021366 [Armillaria borealis]|uniref:Uncharacterized protein n=1 Tax=Armillaria borealis TaxID=47425 RepID=A0AA39JBF9_9AGAR|nr:hypothetical protein EV421DRAFT_2021366 [Armillaria borealis]
MLQHHRLPVDFGTSLSGCHGRRGCMIIVIKVVREAPCMRCRSCVQGETQTLTVLLFVPPQLLPPDHCYERGTNLTDATASVRSKFGVIDVFTENMMSLSAVMSALAVGVASVLSWIIGMWHPRPILHDTAVGDNNDQLTAQSQCVPDKSSTRAFHHAGSLPPPSKQRTVLEEINDRITDLEQLERSLAERYGLDENFDSPKPGRFPRTMTSLDMTWVTWMNYISFGRIEREYYWESSPLRKIVLAQRARLDQLHACVIASGCVPVLSKGCRKEKDGEGDSGSQCAAVEVAL